MSAEVIEFIPRLRRERSIDHASAILYSPWQLDSNIRIPFRLAILRMLELKDH